MLLDNHHNMYNNLQKLTEEIHNQLSFYEFEEFSKFELDGKKNYKILHDLTTHLCPFLV